VINDAEEIESGGKRIKRISIANVMARCPHEPNLSVIVGDLP
jgi:hypothetical protein